MLESNRIPLRTLNRAIELYGERYLLRQLDIHEKTIYRWRTGRTKIPGHQLMALRMLLGDLPGTDGQWNGWRFHGGKLIGPNGDSFQASEVWSISLRYQLIAELKRENQRLRERLLIAEKTLQIQGGVANEAVA